ncbi:MAG: SPOR domain-containing protein [Pikeienuella sp.]
MTDQKTGFPVGSLPMRRLSMGSFSDYSLTARRIALPILAATLFVASCAETQLGAQIAKNAVRTDPEPRQAAEAANPTDPSLAPEEFDATGLTIWDGKLTLQGVWVAHPLAYRARRVRVVNSETGQLVEGAMFRRDPTLSGPSILVSSDAALNLGLKPGQPTELQIVALREEGFQQATSTATLPATTTPAPAPSGIGTLAPAPEPVETAALPQPQPVINPAPTTETQPVSGQVLTPQPAAPAASTTVAAAPTKIEGTGPSKPVVEGLSPGIYVQAGAFGVEGNADALVKKLRRSELPAQYVKRNVNGSIFNIVMIGPLRNDAEVERAKATAKSIGVSGARKVTL